MEENAPEAFTGLVTILGHLREDFPLAGNFSTKTKNRADMTHSFKTVNGTEKVITE